MRYSGENCPYCGLEFHEGDDVVVCPECATPHHRACWFAHGECANEQKHGEGFVWKSTAQPMPEKEAVTKENKSGESKKSLDIVCPDCGKVNPNGTLRCPDCGALLVPISPMGGEPPLAQFRPDFNPDELVGGMKSGDIALFCRVSGARYLKAFRRIAHGSRLGWNWGAAFFSPLWFFYRKLYKPGAIFMALFVAVNLWVMSASVEFTEVYSTIMLEADHIMETEGEEAAYAAVEKNMPELQQSMKPLYLPMALQFLLHIASAVAADLLYYRKAKKDIAAVRGERLEEKAVQLKLFKKGGTSFVGGAAAYFANELLLYLASWIMSQ